MPGTDADASAVRGRRSRVASSSAATCRGLPRAINSCAAIPRPRTANRGSDRYNSGVSTLPAAEPEIDVRTIADLPFHVMGRFQKPLVIGPHPRRRDRRACRARSCSNRFAICRSACRRSGMAAGDRVAIVSESRPEWILTDLAVISGRRASPSRSIRRSRRPRPATSSRTPAPASRSSRPAPSCRRSRRSGTSCRRSKRSS